jgi:hypothetical protein
MNAQITVSFTALPKACRRERGLHEVIGRGLADDPDVE